MRRHEHPEHLESLGGVLGVVCFILVGLAAVELVVGLHSNVGVITSDGGHNLGDAMVMLIGGLFVNRIIRLFPSSHFARHNLRKIADIGVYLITLAVITWGVWEASQHHVIASDLKITIGLVSSGINFSLSYLIDRFGSVDDHAFALELKYDSVAALGVTAAGVGDLFTETINWDVFFALGILVFAIFHLGHEIRDRKRAIHPEEECPEEQPGLSSQ